MYARKSEVWKTSSQLSFVINTEDSIFQFTAVAECSPGVHKLIVMLVILSNITAEDTNKLLLVRTAGTD